RAQEIDKLRSDEAAASNDDDFHSGVSFEVGLRLGSWTGSAVSQQQAFSSPTRPAPNERGRRRLPPGRRTETAYAWTQVTRRSPPTPEKDGAERGSPPRGRVQNRCATRGGRTRPGTRRRRRTSAGRRRMPGGLRCARGCGRPCVGRLSPAPPR